MDAFTTKEPSRGAMTLLARVLSFLAQDVAFRDDPLHTFVQQSVDLSTKEVNLMTAIANISLQDATPAAVVFTPRRRGPEKSLHVSSGYGTVDSVLGDCNLTLGVSPATAKRPTEHVDVTLSFPDPSYDTTSEKLIDVARLKLSFIIPDSFSAANRAHFYALVDSLVGNAVVQTAVEDGEGAY